MLLCFLAKLPRLGNKTREICPYFLYAPQKKLAPTSIHRLPVKVDDVFVLENVFARVKIEPFDLRLRVFERFRDHLILDWLIGGDTKSPHQALDRITCENPHERILKRNIELRLPGIALATRAATQLVVDAPRVVTFRSEDKKPSCGKYPLIVLLCSRISAQLDINTAPGHVGRNHYGAETTRLCDDLSFAFVILCVQYFVWHAFARKKGGQEFILLDRNGADQDRLPFVMEPLYLPRDRGELSFLSLKDKIVLVDTRRGPVWRNRRHFKSVYLEKFLRRGKRGSRHAGKLLVEFEVILKGDRSHRARFGLHFYPLLRFNSLVKPLRPPTSRLKTPGEFVDDNNAIVLDHILPVFNEECFGAHGSLKVVDVFCAFFGINILNSEEFLGLGDPRVRDLDRL